MPSVADVDRMMYECGATVLHPGGLRKSDAMARACGVAAGKFVLDVGVGRGTTACHLAKTHRCTVVGVDALPGMVAAARERATAEGVADLTSFMVADAARLPFKDASLDAVIVECVTTLLDREKVFPELVRVLKKGGRLGDLEMTYREEPTDEFERKLAEAWGGFSSMTIEGWRALFERNGLEVVEVDDFSPLLARMSLSLLKDLGLRGALRVVWRLLRRAELRRAMKEYMDIFDEGEDVFGYAYLVGEKR